MTASTLLTPTVLWAQRANAIFLTIQLEDCSSPDIKIEPSGVHFRGVGGTDQKEYGIDLELYEPIDPENSSHTLHARNIEFSLKKEKDGPYWPRLLKSSGKHHWLKINFEKWADEDESEDEAAQAGGMGGMPGGMGGMAGMGGMGGMGGMQFGGGGGNPFGGGDNTDFEEMMKQMGGLGGAPGMGGGDKPNMEGIGGGESDSDDDNDLPDLE